MKKAVYLFIYILSFSLFLISQPNKVEAGFYFTEILEGVTQSYSTFKKYTITRIFIYQDMVVKNPETRKTETIVEDTEKSTAVIDSKEKESENYLNRIFKSLGLDKAKNTNIQLDCEIPKGPVAFNIGGTDGNGVSRQCKAQTIFSGHNQHLKKGVFGGGYVNPLLEKGMAASGASVDNCRKLSGNIKVAKEYGEKCFSSYGEKSSGFAYVQQQLIHWQQEGKLNNQKCVPVYLDNCDSIGAENYKELLDAIENLNNNGDVKLKIINGNPQNGKCEFLSHPAVIGALIEEVSDNDLRKVIEMRKKPEQLLIFTRGGGGTNERLKQIETKNIPNSAYSYDSGKEYEIVHDCTYIPPQAILSS